MFKIFLGMKTELLLCLFFASELSLFTLTLANFNLQSVTTGTQKLQTPTFNQKLETWENFVGGSIQEYENVNIYSSTPANNGKENFENEINLYNEKLSAAEPDLKYRMLQKENNLSESPYNLNMPTIQQNMNYLQDLINDTSYPIYNHRTHFRDIGQNLYHPKFYYPPMIYPKTFTVRNFEQRFMDLKRHPKFLLKNQDEMLDDSFITFHLDKDEFLSKKIPLISTPKAPNISKELPNTSTVSAMNLNEVLDDSSFITFHLDEEEFFSKKIPLISTPKAPNISKELPNTSTVGAMNLNERHKYHFIKQYEKSSTERDFLKRKNLGLLDKTSSNLNKVAAESERSVISKNEKHEKTNSNDFNISITESLNPHSNDLEFSKARDNEEKDASPFRLVPIRFERNSGMSDMKKGNINKRLYNRVYFEKIPQNLNLSWFVFVNCSRDRCLLSNSSDDVELLNEGWILHNCTYYGCSEMYPRTESVQKFIGLILLVFSLCVLMIIFFILLFYYCRRIKLSKIARTNKGHWDKEKSNATIDEEKFLDNKQVNEVNNKSQALTIEKVESILSKQKINTRSIEPIQDKKLSSIVEEEAEKNDSEIFGPTDENVAPCIVSCAPNRNISNPYSTFETKTGGFVWAIPKCKKKNCSSIPRLEIWKKGSKSEVQKREEQNLSRNTLENVKLTSGGDGGIMLMNLNDEDNISSTTSGQTEKSTNWSTFLQNECDSFISIDLSDEKENKNDSPPI